MTKTTIVEISIVKTPVQEKSGVITTEPVSVLFHLYQAVHRTALVIRTHHLNYATGWFNRAVFLNNFGCQALT